MKKIKNIMTLSLLAVVLSTTSCSDFLNVNTDPNRVTDVNVTPDAIFTQAQNAVGVRASNRFIFLNNWMGYWSRSGTFIVEQEETTYKVANTFSETNWDDTYNILFDMYQVKTRALAVNDSVLAGASMVLSCKLWQEGVDQFGAMPYKQAFDYIKYPRPTYTPAADIYADLLIQLDQAIVYLNAKVPASSFVNADLIFARGNNLKASIVKWKKLANTIKLRMFIRQSEISGFTPPAAQLTKITTDGGVLAQGEDVTVNPGYSNDVNKQNPFYANYGLTPAGAPATTNNKPNNYFIGILSATDLRFDKFYLAPVTGTDYGSLGGTNVPGAKTVVGSEIYPGTPTQDQFILPSYESLFFQAEATVRGWLPGGDGAAKALFISAITESYVFLKVDSAEVNAGRYIADDPTANWDNSGTSVAEKVKFIAYQKYLSLCGIDPVEAWSDLRRGVLVLPAGYLSNNPNRAAHLPFVLPYPQTELTTNSANLPKRTMDQLFTEKLFWQP